MASAKKSILILETYPPVFIPSVKSLLRAASNKGMKVRAMCVVAGVQPVGEFIEPDLIEYKAVPLSQKRMKQSASTKKLLDDPYLKPLSMTFSGPYGVALVDEVEAFVMIQNPTNKTRSIGFSAKIPGVPAILTVMFERLFALGKRMND